MTGGAPRLDINLSGYRIDAVLGHGGMGTVYRAHQLRLGRDVALKIMAPDLAGDPTFRERFLRESQLAARIEHPHIVPVFDAGEVDQILYIAMRYIDGSDLRALIAREGRLAPQPAVAVVAQLAGALDAAHARGLVHRDVKPSNVLVAAASGVDQPLQAYLTDFGISKRVVETTGGSMGRPLGSVQYMSPEQIRGEQVDARSDVYSLGCLLYECLTGEGPFARDSDVAIMYAHLEAPYTPLGGRVPEVLDALDEVLARSLAKDVADRPASTGEFAAAAGDALAGAADAGGRRPHRPPQRVAGVEPPRELGEPASEPSDRARPRRMVGRLDEEAELLSALEDAIGGHGNVVLLSGEPGIGKTTLARWVSREAERRGVATVWGVGGAFGETPPSYWHWIQIVRALARRSDAAGLFDQLGDARAWLAAIAPDIASMLPGIDSSQPAIDEGRFQIYDAVTNLLIGAARASPLLVVLDDLQLADQASLQTLGFVAARVHESRLLVLGTCREDELARTHTDPGGAGEAMAAQLAEIARAGRRVALAPLEPPHVDQLIAARTGAPSPELLTERVHEVTSGNPLFVAELLNLLEVQGKLTEPGEASGALPLPSGISEAIAQRLTPLSREGRDALGVAAVIGTSFRASTVARAAGLDPAEVIGLLDDAIGLRLVRQASDFADAYAFSHGLVQATLYEALPRAKRCALHAAVGEALMQSRDVGAGEALAEIAYHFLEAAPAGGEERAADYATRAAEQAVRTFSYDQAVTLYSRALQVVGSAAAAQRIALLLALGEAQMRAGDSDAARTTLMRAADAARAHDDSLSLARAALACNIWALSLGVDEPLVQLAEDAVERLEGSHETGVLACVKGLLAVTLYWSDQVERRERLAAEALALARADHQSEQSRESEHVLAYVLARYILTMWGPSSAVEHLVLSDELLVLTRKLRDIELEILTRNWRVTVLLELGRFAAVDQEIARVQQIATDLRQPRAMVFLPLHHGSRAGTSGRFAEAERLNAESIEIGRHVRGTVGELAATAQLLSIRLQQGRLVELEPAVRAIANGNPGMKAMQAVLPLIMVQSGREREAAFELERLMSTGSAGFPRDNSYIVTLAVLAEVASELADGRRAGELYEWLEPYAGRWVVSAGAAALWPVDRSLARLATIAGDTERARTHLQRARAQAAGTGAAPSIALLALDEARLLFAEGRAGDRPRIGALSREARELAQRLGMGLVVDAATLLEAEVAD